MSATHVHVHDSQRQQGGACHATHLRHGEWTHPMNLPLPSSSTPPTHSVRQPDNLLPVPHQGVRKQNGLNSVTTSSEVPAKIQTQTLFTLQDKSVVRYSCYRCYRCYNPKSLSSSDHSTPAHGASPASRTSVVTAFHPRVFPSPTLVFTTSVASHNSPLHPKMKRCTVH